MRTLLFQMLFFPLIPPLQLLHLPFRFSSFMLADRNRSDRLALANKAVDGSQTATASTSPTPSSSFSSHLLRIKYTIFCAEAPPPICLSSLQIPPFNFFIFLFNFDLNLGRCWTQLQPTYAKNRGRRWQTCRSLEEKKSDRKRRQDGTNRSRKDRQSIALSRFE